VGIRGARVLAWGMILDIKVAHTKPAPMDRRPHENMEKNTVAILETDDRKSSSIGGSDLDSKVVPVIRERRSDVEVAVDTVVAHPPMTFKRFMVLLSLIWLVVTSATPILFITAALCALPLIIS
jgi:hypothetical protein